MHELIYGNEPYFINKYQKEIEEGLLMPSFNLRVSNQFTDLELEFVQQAPFCSKRRVLIIQQEKLSPNDKLENYLKKPVPQTDLYLFVSECDKRLSIYKSFGHNVKIFNKCSPEILEKWIVNYLNNKKIRITKKAYAKLVEYINYELEEVNLYQVKGVLNRLCSSETVITPELIESMVSRNEKGDIFNLIRLIDEGKEKELFHQSDLIINNQQNIIGTLSLLLKSYRIVYKTNVAHASLSDIGVYYRAYVPKLTKMQADEGIRIIQACIHGLKSGKYLPELSFKLCLAKLCQLKK